MDFSRKLFDGFMGYRLNVSRLEPRSISEDYYDQDC